MIKRNRDKVIRELDAFHHRVLNSKLAEKITEKEIMAIINAASILIEDEKKIKELADKKIVKQFENLIRTRCPKTAYTSMISGDICESYVVTTEMLDLIAKELSEHTEDTKDTKDTKNCVGCKHFVGCECFDGQICHRFKEV